MNKPTSDQDMRPEYDFSGGVRGKHYQAYHQGSNIVLLEPDVAAIFKDSASVNHALRMLMTVAQAQVDKQSSKDDAGHT